MIPKFRAWYILAEQMITEITSISYIHHAIIGQDRDGDMLVPLKFYDERNGPEVLLMQSTGLKDKNGVEIFEGDVVTIDTDEFDKLIVRYREGAYWMCDGEFNVEVLSEYYKFLEVLGNIYETPELMEVAE